MKLSDLTTAIYGFADIVATSDLLYTEHYIPVL